jgi:hypothetical protein
MTTLGAVASGLLSYTGAGSAYAKTATIGGSTSQNKPSVPASTAATNVTLSASAMAALAAQDADTTTGFDQVTANARSVIDQLLAQAKVTSPVNANGDATIDLSGLDGRTLFAIASNSQSVFSSDEQSVAAQEIQNRFDAMIKPRLAASDLTGNYTDVYKAAADYFDKMAPEEKLTTSWSAQRTAINQALTALKTNPAALPAGIDNDPVADFATRSLQKQNPYDVNNFGDVTSAARAALDAQATAATRSGSQITYGQGKGTPVDWSQFGTQDLSAVVLNQDNQFSPQETRSAKQELDSRNRQSILQALKQSQASGDPTALSYSLLTQYSNMSAQERQASNWTTSFRDNAVANYKSASNLMSMLNQMGGGNDQSGGGFNFLSGLG